MSVKQKEKKLGSGYIRIIRCNYKDTKTYTLNFETVCYLLTRL